MLLDFRKPNVSVVDKCISWSGKYFCFLGSHYEAGKICWVVGSSNKVTGEIVMRHYSETNGAIAPKAQAATEWEKYKAAMVKAPESEEQDEFGYGFNPSKYTQ